MCVLVYVFGKGFDCDELHEINVVVKTMGIIIFRPKRFAIERRLSTIRRQAELLVVVPYAASNLLGTETTRSHEQVYAGTKPSRAVATTTITNGHSDEKFQQHIFVPQITSIHVVMSSVMYLAPDITGTSQHH